MNVQELFSLEGRCAVVIGGGGKIGFPMAEALAEAGATVWIASSREESFRPAVEKLGSAGLDARGIPLDQSDEGSVLEALGRISAESRSPEVLVNSGCNRPMTRFMDDSVENWDKSMAVNARGLFITCRAFGKRMADAGGGSIINVTSIYGLVAPDMAIYEGSAFETEPDYPFTKGGAVMFSKFLASYWSKKGVRVNCIAPGGFFNDQPEPFLSKYTAKVPMGRMAYHDDLKGAALFLASPASQYITGCVIPVDGGFTVT